MKKRDQIHISSLLTIVTVVTSGAQLLKFFLTHYQVSNHLNSEYE